VTLPLTPSVAPPLSGGWDLTPHLERKHQDRFAPLPRQRPRTSSIQSAFHRKRHLARLACAMRCQAKPPTSAIHAISEHSPGSPGSPVVPSAQKLALQGQPPPGDVAPCGATKAALRRIRTRSAFAAQDSLCARPARSRAQTHDPDPSRLDTFCRKLVGRPAGEAELPRGRTPFERAHLRPPAPACEGAGSLKDRLPLSPATGSAFRNVQGVFRL